MKLIFVCLFIVSAHLFSQNECSENLKSKDGAGTEDIEFEEVDEWQRYIKFNRQQTKRNLEKKKQRRSKSDDKKMVAPSFVLSRTRSGIVVKQHEPGSTFKSKGGFDFPVKPILLTNVQYKFDGSISPVIRLSETDKGVVGKKLEYGKAKEPGLNWDGRSGSAKFKRGGRSGQTIGENGEVNKDAGINKDFSDGSISTRGTLEMKIKEDTDKISFEPVEPLPDDNTYSNESAEFENADNSFETEDKYYDEQDDYEDDYGDNDNSQNSLDEYGSEYNE